MRINILQHTPNEKAGSILEWAKLHHHDVYTYHPYQFGKLPTDNDTDMLVILGGPMSPNDDLPWIHREYKLVSSLLSKNIPILGVCFGAQLIAKILGGKIVKAPFKEVGWAPVYLQSHLIPNIPEKATVLHWHEDMFEIPPKDQLLFSSDHVKNQGYLYQKNVIGLQFHFEPLDNNVKEIVVNDYPYIDGSVLNQSKEQIINKAVPKENKQIMFQLLDYITAHSN